MTVVCPMLSGSIISSHWSPNEERTVALAALINPINKTLLFESTFIIPLITKVEKVEGVV